MLRTSWTLVRVRSRVLEFELQLVTKQAGVPTQRQFAKWVENALEGNDSAVLVVRVVDEEESGQLNKRYRGISGPTNVLSFPAELHETVPVPLLGDVVICAPVVVREANEQGKPEEAHWAHLTIHGVLHLCGHDHQNETEARQMESLEIRLLEKLGYANPYEITDK